MNSHFERPSGQFFPSRPPPACAPDRVAVVVNGRAKQVTDELVDVLDQIVQSGDLFVSRSLEEGRLIARTIVEREYRTVLTGGGDGTFVQMVTWIAEEAARQKKPRPRFGLLRLGTGNALAWVLGAQSPKGRGVIADLARLSREGGRRAMHLLDVEGTLTPFAGLGIDARALEHFQQTRAWFEQTPGLRMLARGGIMYATSIVSRTMPEYLVRPRENVRIINEGAEAVRLGVDGQPLGPPIAAGEVIYQGPCRMVCMSTIPYWGFGARVFPFANDRSDRFNLRVVHVGPVDVALHIRSIWKGTYHGDRVHDFLVDRIAVHCTPPMPFQIGGDPVGARETAIVGLAPETIDVVDYYSPPPV